MARNRDYGPSFSTIVLSGVLVLSLVFTIGILVWTLVQANHTKSEYLDDIKTQVHICLLTPGCQVDRGYALETVRCILTEEAPFWRLTWRDGSSSTVITDCTGQMVPYLPEDVGVAPEVPTTTPEP